jgi:hypothetical protein
VAIAAASDVLYSLGVFLGAPLAVWLVLVHRELRRLRRERSEWRREDATVHEEGFPPGPPVEPSPCEGEVLEVRVRLEGRHRSGAHRQPPRFWKPGRRSRS